MLCAVGTWPCVPQPHSWTAILLDPTQSKRCASGCAPQTPGRSSRPEFQEVDSGAVYLLSSLAASIPGRRAQAGLASVTPSLSEQVAGILLSSVLPPGLCPVGVCVSFTICHVDWEVLRETRWPSCRPQGRSQVPAFPVIHCCACSLGGSLLEVPSTPAAHLLTSPSSSPLQTGLVPATTPKVRLSGHSCSPAAALEQPQ